MMRNERKVPFTGKNSKACAQCGEALVASTWSEYVSRHRVRHLWSCDACGYEFETTVYLASAEQEEILDTAA
jgi:ribosomal protein L37AE/L43A